MKRIIFIYIALISAVLLTPFISHAQSERNENILKSYIRGLEYQIKAGFNVGGTAPIPLPPEIRQIKKYSPNIAIAISGEVTKWMGVKKRWGLAIALKLETKAMSTQANVKNYGMEIIGDGGEKVSGRWTGHVNTKVRNSYITLPVLASFRASDRWAIKAGPYVSCLIDGEFSGYVYDGYLRENDPIGEKVIFEDGKTANYNFSNDLRTFQWGAQIGAEWKVFKHLHVYGELAWGLNNIFKKDFKTISFAMYPIYANFGFGYMF